MKKGRNTSSSQRTQFEHDVAPKRIQQTVCSNSNKLKHIFWLKVVCDV